MVQLIFKVYISLNQIIVVTQTDYIIFFSDMEDSYATLSLSTQPKKSSSSTRVLTNDKDPKWNENLYVLVYKGVYKK